MVANAFIKTVFSVVFRISLVGTQWAMKPGAHKKQRRSIKLHFQASKNIQWMVFKTVPLRWFPMTKADLKICILVCCFIFTSQRLLCNFTIRSPSKDTGGMRLILAGRSCDSIWWGWIRKDSTEVDYSWFETNMRAVCVSTTITPITSVVMFSQAFIKPPIFIHVMVSQNRLFFCILVLTACVTVWKEKSIFVSRRVKEDFPA